MRYDPYGYPIFPGDRGYSSCGGDVDRLADDESERFEQWMQRKWEESKRAAELKRYRKEAQNGLPPDSASSRHLDSPT